MVELSFVEELCRLWIESSLMSILGSQTNQGDHAETSQLEYPVESYVHQVIIIITNVKLN